MLVKIKLFKDKLPQEFNDIPRPLKLVTQEDKKTWLPHLYKQGWKDTTTTTDLQNLPNIQEVATIVTDNLLVLDFDTDESYQQALDLNTSLPEEQQSKLIVQSSRKGGHIYYSYNDTLVKQITPLHSSQGIIDILAGPGHNVLAPTKGNSSVIVTPPTTNLTDIPLAMLALVNYIVLSNTSTTAKTVYVNAKDGHSDDNYFMLEQFITGRIGRQTILDYYNLPDIMEPQTSQTVMLRFAHRLLCDETVELENVRQVLKKYDTEGRKTEKEIVGLTNPDTNKFVEDKATATLTLTHKIHKTTVYIYYDTVLGDVIAQYTDSEGKPQLLVRNTVAKMKEALEILTGINKSNIKQGRILPVKIVESYKHKGGFHYQDMMFNRTYSNKYLTAFKTDKELDNYSEPTKLITLLQSMLCEEYDYTMAWVQYKYRHFKHSPVVHHIVGVEGSGKDTLVKLLCRGFNEDTQSLSYELYTDKHANHHIAPNSLISEIGDWSPMEQKQVLSNIKMLTGSQGKVTLRGMGQASRTVTTINTHWVNGNNWARLHTDPNNQRRIHCIYMARPLDAFRRPEEHEDYFEDEELLVNFFYWLGNRFQPEQPFNEKMYMDAQCRQQSTAYHTYISSVEGQMDLIVRLLPSREWEQLVKTFSMGDLNYTIEDFTYKYKKDGDLAVSLRSLARNLGRADGDTRRLKETLEQMNRDEPSTLLVFDGSPEKYITIYNAPMGLGTGAEEQLKAK